MVECMMNICTVKIAMFYEIMGIAAFVLYFLYDVNSVLWKNKILNTFFFAGTGILLIAAVGVFTEAAAGGFAAAADFPGYVRITAAVFLAVFLILLVYTLFFAVPFQKTYMTNTGIGNGQNKRRVCKMGMYALCRHPGVLWFTGIFMCLWIEFPGGQTGIFSAEVCIMNVAYVVFQDKWTFTKVFCDYDTYKKEVPFLIPTVSSTMNCLKTMKG